MLARKQSRSNWRTSLKKFVKCECGATSIEYALMAVMVAIAIITVLNEINVEITNVFGSVKAGFQAAQ